MSELALRVENLSKVYRIGAVEEQPRGLRQAAAGLASAPFAYLNRMRRLPTEEETLWALRDVSFDVKQGEVVGIIGRNGAGKSTLLKILSRITEPSSGQAEVYGRIASLLEVGTGFHPELTGRENIYLNGAILGMKRDEIERKFDEIVDFSGVERFLDTPVKRYSSGMYLRLAFAVAAHLEPEILLVDEVLAVGDVAFQQKCLGKMEDVAKDGRTVLLVSHNLTYITYACSRALLLVQGELVADGHSALVGEHYLSQSAKTNLDGVLAFDTSRLLVIPQVSIPLVELLSEEGKSLERVHGGKSLRVRIHYCCKESIVSPSFVIVFSTPTGIELLRLSTMPISGYHLTRLQDTGYVDCLIESVPFTGGSYVVGVGLGRPNVEYLIFEKEVGGFEISPYDAYNSGFGVDQRCGVVATPHQWQTMSTMDSAEGSLP